jgi:hypothetical protein
VGVLLFVWRRGNCEAQLARTGCAALESWVASHAQNGAASSPASDCRRRCARRWLLTAGCAGIVGAVAALATPSSTAGGLSSCAVRCLLLSKQATCCLGLRGKGRIEALCASPRGRGVGAGEPAGVPDIVAGHMAANDQGRRRRVV